MHRINCPFCGLRDEAEFRYRGDAGAVRPAVADDGSGDPDGFFDYLHTRKNPKGWHVELWHHAYGCRQFVKVVRHTVTHEIRATGSADTKLEVPSS